MYASTWDRWLAHIIVRRRWQKNPKTLLGRIASFEATEDDSAWQLLHAAHQLPEAAAKAQLLMQALEETHHAEIFRGLYKRSAGHKLQKQAVERKPLLKPEAPWKLFVYFAVGERAAAQRFQSIVDSLDAGPFQTSLRKILEEEQGHIGLAGKLVQTTGQSPRSVQWEMRRVQAVRGFEAWLRVGRHLSSILSRLLLSGAYYSLGWFLRKGEAR